MARSGPDTWIGVSSMPDPMTGSYEGPPRAERVEVITSVQRRWRWSTEEKVRIVEETYLPGNSVSLGARGHGIAGNQLFTWRRLMAHGALTAAGAGEGVVGPSEDRGARRLALPPFVPAEDRPASSWPSASARRRASGRDPGARRRPADLRLST